MNKGSSRRATSLSKVWLGSMAALVATATLVGGLARAGDNQAKIEARTFELDNFQDGASHATCPGSKRAVGGGFVQIGSANGIRLGASGPVGPSGSPSETKDGDRAKFWYVSVLNASGEDNRQFKVYAICSGNSDAKIEAKKFAVAYGQVDRERVSCPRDKRVVGGGVVHLHSGQSKFVQASGPVDASGSPASTKDGDIAKQWYAATYNGTSKQDDKFKIYAICSATSDATIEVTKFVLGNNETGGAKAKCPGSRHALGGGVFAVRSPDESQVGANGPLAASESPLQTDDGDAAKFWYGTIENFFKDENHAFKVVAICA